MQDSRRMSYSAAEFPTGRAPVSPNTLIPRKLSGRKGSPIAITPASSSQSGLGLGTPPSSSSLPGFRSFRSLLPFGPGKQATPITPSVSGNPQRSPFANFGSVRRSINRDRRHSSSTVNEDPVISIDANEDVPADDQPLLLHQKSWSDYTADPFHGSRASEDQNRDRVLHMPTPTRDSQPRFLLPSPASGSLLGADLAALMESNNASPLYSAGSSKTATSSSERIEPKLLPAANVRSSAPYLPSPSPGPPIGDLSTILEAETSGISKHIPDVSGSQGKTPSPIIDAPSHPPSALSFHPPPAKSAPTPDHDTSALDLSTSQIQGEILDAMVQDYAAAHEWLSGADAVVVDADVVETTVRHDVRPTIREPSLILDSLDPDLAALLSPHRIGTGASTSTSARSTVVGFPSTPRASQDSLDGAPSETTVLARASPFPSPSRADRQIGAQSSPVRRSLSISRLAPPRARTASSSLPRLRVAHSPGSPASPHPSPSPSKDAAPAPTPDSPAESYRPRGGSIDRALRYPAPASPLSRPGSRGRLEPVGESASASPRAPAPASAPSRLATPARHAPPYTPPALAASPASAPAARPPLRRTTTDSSSPDSSSPASPQTAAGARLGPRRGLAERDRAFLLRSRKRSMSVGAPAPAPPSASTSHAGAHDPDGRPASSLARPAAEWLGPRTAKAFAAAGLLDFDRERDRDVGRGFRGGRGGAASRMAFSEAGAPRGGSYEGAPSRMGFSEAAPSRMGFSEAAPSRMGFSEASGSVSSWGRSGSGRARAPSDAPLMSSPTFTQRTGSTAPTSVSGAPGALAALKEKHDVETGALLAALSDSQRTAKVLREENAELRARIGELEDALDDARRALRAPPAPAPRRSLEGWARPGSSDGPRARAPFGMHSPNAHSREVPAVSRWQDTSATVSPAASVAGAPLSPPGARRRFSIASSVFPVLPSNMSMLLHEPGDEEGGGGGEATFALPASPTHHARRSDGSRRGHAANASISSAGNISPTTATFSMSGSPGSLFLRPEHEMHLGDLNMTSLDLGLRHDDEDDGYGAD